MFGRVVLWDGPGSALGFGSHRSGSGSILLASARGLLWFGRNLLGLPGSLRQCRPVFGPVARTCREGHDSKSNEKRVGERWRSKVSVFGLGQ